MLSRLIVSMLALMMLVGCGSDDEPSAGGSSSGATASGEATPSTEPSGEAEPEVAPATGKKLTIEHLGELVASYRAPTRKWYSTGRSATWSSINGSWYLGGGAGITYPEISLDDAAEIAIENIKGRFAKVKRLDDRTVDGIEGYVIEGGAGKELFYEFGATYEEAFVTISLEIPVDTAAARGVIESVLASFEWV